MSSFIDQVIERANIVDIISKYVSLKKMGANYFGLCPFHPDKHPSMSVSNKKKIFKCFSCNTSGNVINFVQKINKISFGEALKQVALASGFTQKEIDDYFNNKHSKNYNPYQSHFYSLNNKANDLFQLLLFNDSNKKYLDYLQKRKLSLETIKSFNLGFCGKDNAKTILFDLITSQNNENSEVFNADDFLKASLININEQSSEIVDYFFNRITFPIKDKNGFIIGFIGRNIDKTETVKYLTSRETILFHKADVFYNLDQVYYANVGTLIILEGNIDLISFYEAGLDTSKYGVVALMGTAFTTNHLNILKQIKTIKNIILCLDNDEAGRKNTLSIGLQLLKGGYQIFVVKNNSKHKDINDILVNEGKKQVLDLLSDNNLLDFFIFYISHNLVSLNLSNTTSLVEQILGLIAKYGNSLYWSKYRDLIAQITKLDPEDLNITFKKIASNRYAIKDDKLFINIPTSENVATKSDKEKRLLLNLQKVIGKILREVFFTPSTSKDFYLAILHKDFNIAIIKDILTFVKYIANLDSDNLDFEAIFQDLIKNKIISVKTMNFINKCYDDFISLKNDNNTPKYNKERYSALANSFDKLCWKLKLEQLEQKLKITKLDSERTKIKSQIKKIKSKLLKIKANKNIL